ncbi:MAG TPA: response regulator [Acidimicrobiales bacterium]|nr:response regulator [Acidimicrobiales bacterium]
MSNVAIHSSRTKLTTVVADDVLEVRGLLVDALLTSGRFEVVGEAADGFGAVETVSRLHPDLALVDLGMPAAGGLDVLEELNQNSPDTRVVVVSGFAGRRLEELAASRGAAAYVRKRLSIRAVVDDILAAAGMLEIAESVLTESRVFERDPRSGREARRFVGDVLEMWECSDVLDTVHLLLSELVTNAVIHARSAPDVAVRLLPQAIRIEVGDDDPTVPATPASADPLGTSGRGLQILESYADRWGIEARAGGKVVWFEVPRLDARPATSA